MIKVWKINYYKPSVRSSQLEANLKYKAHCSLILVAIGTKKFRKVEVNWEKAQFIIVAYFGSFSQMFSYLNSIK